jgi:hypothetical protein
MAVASELDTAARPLVTVIVAVHNGVRSLQRCIDSVAVQTLVDHELIVMDGGSTDGTAELLAANSAKIDYWESTPDRGIYHAWNKAVARARGEWLCFLGADDYLWAPDTLERFQPHLRTAFPSHRIVYGAVAAVTRSGKTVGIIDQPWEQARHRFFVTMTIPHPGTFHHRSLFTEYGLFDESFRQAGDYEFLLRELRSHLPRYVPGLIQAAYEEGGVTVRLGSVLRGTRERREALVRNGIPVSPGRTALMYVQDLGRVGLRVVFGETTMRRAQRAYRRIAQHRVFAARDMARQKGDAA